MFYKNAFVSALIATVISILFSVTVTYTVQYINGVREIGTGIAIAVVVPLIVAPLGSYPYFRTHFELLKVKRELEHVSRTDSLTGLYNRRAFWEFAQHALDRAEGTGTPIALLIIDLDHFKQINDTQGHLAGDVVLHETSRRMQRCLQQQEVLARFGGEEFIALLPRTNVPQAIAVARQLHAEIQHRPVPTEQGHIAVTVSLGIAVAEMPPYDLSDLIRRADRALYHAKAQGRNRYEIDASSAGPSQAV